MIIQNLPKTEKFAEGVLKYFPNNTWPPGFEELFTEESQIIPASKWLVSHGYTDKSTDQLLPNKFMDTAKWHHWGNRIFTTAKESKTIINSWLNKKWVPARKLKSGRNVTGLHLAIREFYITSYLCPVKAKQYVDRERRRISKAIKDAASENKPAPRGPLTDEEETTMYDSKMTDEKSKRSAEHFFPEEYLTWLLIGKPNIIGLGVCATLNSGYDNRIPNRPSDRNVSGASALLGGTQYDADQPVGASRDARRRFHEYNATSSVSGSSTSTKTIQHTVSICKPEEDQIYKKMKLLEKEIAICEQLQEDTEVPQRELLRLVREARLLLDQDSTNTSSSMRPSLGASSSSNHRYASGGSNSNDTPISRLTMYR
jgi:hypothetical protein